MTVDAVVRLEPLAVGVDQRHQRHRDVERRARDLGEAVEARLGVGVEDAEVPQRGEALGLAGGQRGGLPATRPSRATRRGSFVRRCDCEAGHTSQSVISGRISLARRRGGRRRTRRSRPRVASTITRRVGGEVVERAPGRGLEHDDRGVPRAHGVGELVEVATRQRLEALGRRRVEQRVLDVGGRSRAIAIAAVSSASAGARVAVSTAGSRCLGRGRNGA